MHIRISPNERVLSVFILAFLLALIAPLLMANGQGPTGRVSREAVSRSKKTLPAKKSVVRPNSATPTSNNDARVIKPMSLTPSTWLSPKEPANEYFNKGLDALREEKNEEALNAFTAAINIDPKFALAYANRGVVRYIFNDYAGVIADLNQAIQLTPGNSYMYNTRGSAKIDLKDYQGAITDLNQAIQLNPTYANAYNTRGSAKLKVKDYAGALSDFNQAIRLDPNDMMSYDSRGLVKRLLGDTEGACEDFRRACREGGSDLCQKHIDKFCTD